MKTNETIRFANSKDINDIIELCYEHAEFEQAEYKIEGKKKNLSKDLFSSHPKLYCLVAESENQILGYATFMKQYSTWEAADYIYMDCLYLIESARGLGTGEELIKRIKSEGRKLNCKLIQWQTPNFNNRAMKFYHKIGATSKTKERFFLKI